MSSHLSQEDARAIARVLFAVHQRRAARNDATHEIARGSDMQGAAAGGDAA